MKDKHGHETAVFVNPLREEFLRYCLAEARDAEERAMAYRDALEWPEHLLEPVVEGMRVLPWWNKP